MDIKEPLRERLYLCFSLKVQKTIEELYKKIQNNRNSYRYFR